MGKLAILPSFSHQNQVKPHWSFAVSINLRVAAACYPKDTVYFNLILIVSTFDLYPPDDCAECPRRQVKVLGLREAGWGNVGGQPDVPVQVEHGDVVSGLRLDLALVEAHDVLVQRVADHVYGEVGVRRELLLQQLVVLSQDNLKL